MTLLTEFLLARIAEDEARARRMAVAVWPKVVAIVPSMDTGEAPPGEPQGCVSVGPQYAPKAYARVWNPRQMDGRVPGDDNFDHGWRYHESATMVWGADAAARILADCEAKRRIIAIAVAEWDPETIDRAIRLNQRGTTIIDEDGQPETVAEWTTTRLLRALAAVYADHPDYQPEWKP